SRSGKEGDIEWARISLVNVWYKPPSFPPTYPFPCSPVATAQPVAPPIGPSREYKNLQVAMVIEPKISIGGGNASSTPTYNSTGGQARFRGDFSQGQVQFCGGVTFWPGFVIGPTR